MPDSFMYLNSHYFNNKKSLIAIRRKAKAFEKEVFSHINTRIKMENFILGLIHPDREVPRWYLNWCLAFDRGVETDPIIKKKIGLLPAASRDLITAFIREELDQSGYSSAMRSADLERDSNSEHFVLGDSELNQFFMVLFGLLLDVSILVNIFSLTGPLIVLAGDGHIYNIVKWLVKNGGLVDEKYTKNALGYINLEEPIYTRSSPQNPLQPPGEVLKAFRRRDSRG